MVACPYCGAIRPITTLQAYHVAALSIRPITTLQAYHVAALSIRPITTLQAYHFAALFVFSNHFVAMLIANYGIGRAYVYLLTSIPLVT